MWGVCTRTVAKVRMMRPCGLVKSCHLVKPVSATLVAGRHLTQQEGLPSLSVPPLQQTCERYLIALEPIMEVDELKRAKQLVEEFQKPGGIGERLQRGLERKARNTENWSSDRLVGEYLKNRKPLVVHSNVGTFLPPTSQAVRDKWGQMRSAAKVIASVLDLKSMIDNDTLPVEYMRGMPLCMKPYHQMLSSCRIPGLEKDSLVYYAKSSSPPKHITVVHNSEFFVLDVYHSDGTPLTVDQLCVQLEKISNASLQTSMEPVGILTTQYRGSWNKTYINLIKDETNKESVSAIERGIFTLCLDGPMPQLSDDMYDISAAKQILHGGGSQWNSGNRWFDKALQIIVGEDGTCGINCVHTITDGTIQMALVDYFAAHMKKSEIMQSPMVPLPMPQKLHFNITPEIKKDIEETKHSMDILAQDLDLRVKVFDHFGKNVIKALKMSPDAFIQMAIQLAYYRMYQRCSSVFEAASLRMFRMGRTEGIRATSSASAAFVKAFDDPRKQNTEKVDLLEKAVKVHTSLSYMAVIGQGIDEHLEGLKTQAIEEKIPMPDFFTDISYTKAFDYDLSTSQVPSRNGCLPVTCVDKPNGYDLSYTFMNDRINFVATAIKSCKETNAAHLIQALEDTLLDMRTLLEQTPRV
ncbi:carnitine O-acetyltransferase-like isoform X1 [Thunnus maccoyii]|uniref:carnitine O-acetyltransferase-like isoform X1 n=1 Tax=Thunnus maccoyii TaxID=8240 RepID=UPI001C4B6443|nr:carnitine O-acetyltransferase-like isoform X1 [Thunnus maccoyii]